MNWYQNILWEIKFWLKWNWFWICVVLLLGIVISFGTWKLKTIPKGVLFPLKVERITDIVEGELISIRATGAWNIHNTELKFEDGSMILVTYSFSQRHNLKAGKSYKIWDSSIYGRQCEENK